MRVLLVEDDVDLSRQLKTALGDAGYAVDHAPDGEEAWFLGDTEPYDVVVLDLGLPKIDFVLDKQHPHSVVSANPAGLAVNLYVRHASARILPAHHIVAAAFAHAQHPAGTARLDATGDVARIRARGRARRIAQPLSGIVPGLLATILGAILIAIPVAAARLGRRVRQGDDGDQTGQQEGSNTHHGLSSRQGPLNRG